jgi:hypothetical protein
MIYSDYMRMSYSLVTFNIELSLSLPHEVGEDPKCRYIGTVIMSPPQAKILLNLLQDQVTKYESTFGEIKSLIPK